MGFTTALSRREEQIVFEAAGGLTDKEIALRLNIAPGSVRTYWERMRRKLDANNRSEIIAQTYGTLCSKATERAEHAELLLNAVVSEDPQAVALVDLETGEVLKANQKMTSLCRSDLAHSNGRELHHHPASGLLEGILKELRTRAERDEVVLNNYLGRFTIRSVRILDGERELALIEVSNTTEGRAQAIPHDNELFRGMLRISEDGILVISRKGVILFASEAALRATSRTEQELIGRNIEELLTSESQALRLKGGGSYEGEMTFRGHTGEPLRVLARVSNRLHDRAVRGIVLSLRTVSGL